MTNIEIVFYDAVKHRHFLPAIVNLHFENIEFDNSLLRYHPPFTQEKREKMSKFWEERIDQVVNSRRIIFLALTQSSDGKSEPELAGLVELGMPEADTGPFRGDVEMLMVSANHRNHGVGKRLMHELERVAVEKGRTLLVSQPHTIRQHQVISC